MAEQISASRTDRSAPRRSRRRLWLLLAGGLLLALVVLVALLPQIAEALVPRQITFERDGRTTGVLSLQDLDLSWTGPQRVGRAVLTDRGGGTVADLSVVTSAGLWGVATGAMGLGDLDLGTTTLQGKARIVMGPDSRTNVEDAVGADPRPSSQPPSQEPVRLPAGLKGRLVLNGLDITYIDRRPEYVGTPAAVARVQNLTGAASIDVGGPAAATLNATVLHGPDEASATTPGGALALDATASGLTDASGELTPNLATINAKLEASALSVAVLDTVAGLENRLVAALGERLDATVLVDGTGESATASLRATSPRADAALALAYQGGTLRTTEPGQIRVDTSGLAPLIEASEAEGGVRLTSLPEVRLTLEHLLLKLPAGSTAPDLRGSAARVTLSTGPTEGTVLVPAAAATSEDPAPAGTPQPFRIAPVEMLLDAPDLAQTVRLTGRTSATISGRSAGDISVDLAATGLLDEAGAPRVGPPTSVQGAVIINEVATAIAEPFVPEGVLDLNADIGPALDLELRAVTLEPTGPADVPPTRLTIAANSDNLRATGGATLSGGVLAAPEQALQVTLQSVGPLLGRMLADAGVQVANAGPVTFTVSDLRADLARLGGETPDYSAVAARAQLQTGPIAGSAVLAEGEPARAWQIAPINATIDARELASGASVNAATSLMLDGRPAGNVDIDLRAAGLLDAAGAVAVPRTIDGQARITGVSTALAQRFLPDTGLDLARDLGPTLDVQLTAATAGEAPAPAAGQIRPTRLNLAATSENLTANAAAMIDEGAIATTGEGVRLQIRRAAPILASLMGEGVSADGDGGLTASVTGLRVPLVDRSPRLDRATGQVALKTGGMTLQIAPAAGSGRPPERIAVQQVDLAAALAPDAAPRVTLNAAMAHGDQPVSATADLSLPGLFAPEPPADRPAPALALRPVGRVELKGVPTSLARLGLSPPAEPGVPDTARLIAEAVGPAVNLLFTSTPTGEGGPLDVGVRLDGERLNAQADASLAPDRLDVRTLTLRSTVTHQLASTLIAAYAPQMQPPPRLSGPFVLTASMTPLAVPLGGGLTPDLAAAPPATITANLQGAAIVEGLTVAGETPEQRRDLGPVGVSNVRLTATVPPAAFAAPPADAPAAPKPATIEFAANLLSGPEQVMGELTGNAQTGIAAGRPVGELTGSVRIANLDGKSLDRLAGEQGLVSGALGNTLGFNAKIHATLAPAPPVPATPAGQNAASAAPAIERANIEVFLGSPLFKLPRAVQITMDPNRLTLVAPVEATWTVYPAWANRFLQPAEPPAQQPRADAGPQRGGVDQIISRPRDPLPGPPAPAPAAQAVRPAPDSEALPTRFTAPIELALNIPTLTLARGGGVESGPLKPGVFQLNAQAAAPSVQMRLPEGVAAAFRDLQVSIVGGRQPGAVAFSLTAQDAGAAPANDGGGGPGGSDLRIEGAIRQLADAQGVLTTDRAAVTANANLRALPTALVDALANQGGVLVEALGPRISLQANAENLSAQGGTLSVQAESSRAQATLAGSVRDGVLVASGPAGVQVREITPELGRALVTGLPILGQFSKPPTVAPAIVRATGLRIPIEGDVSKLRGDITIDLGEAQFQVSRVFAALLEGVGAREAGVLGQRLEPIKLQIRDGVVTYERFRIPLGEFAVETRGTVDLVSRRVNVITYLPLGSLTEEAAGGFRGDLGRLLGRAVPSMQDATMVPFRTSGTFDKTETRPDLDLFAEEFTSQLRPGDVIGGGLQELLEGLQRNRRDRDGK